MSLSLRNFTGEYSTFFLAPPFATIIKQKKGKISPHYGARMVDFDKILCYNNGSAYGLEDNSAILIENETVRGAISSGGTAWKIESADGELKKSAVELILI